MQHQRLDDDDGSVKLRISGELDALTAPEVRSTMDGIVADRPREVVIDLSELRLIDSSGVGALVSLYKRARAQGTAVRVVGVNDQPAAIFRLLRLDTVFAAA
jgi:anti-sigma B factor antagonist